MIEIERALCVGCGQCVQVCPFTVLKIDEEGKAVNTGKTCIRCMHCGAICPQDAITYNGKKAVLREAVKPLAPDCLQYVERLIYQRRSYRRFLEKEIPDEAIAQALQAGMWAPSAKNQHPTKWLVIRNREVRGKMMELILDYCRRENVSSEVVSECEAGNNPVIGENATLILGYCPEFALNPAQDTAIALTTAELVLQAQGIGTCWAGYLTRFCNAVPGMRELLKLPRRQNVYGALMAGYPDQRAYEKIPTRLKGVDVRYL